MIKYRLICDENHEFEGWFQTIDSFESQNKNALISCPICNSVKVRRALMTPNLASPKRRKTELDGTVPLESTELISQKTSLQTSEMSEKMSDDSALAKGASVAEINEAMSEIRQLQRKIKAECRDVGDNFAEEARKIHYGEVAPENIYGHSSEKEREALAEEGIDVLALPWLPPEH